LSVASRCATYMHAQIPNTAGLHASAAVGWARWPPGVRQQQPRALLEDTGLQSRPTTDESTETPAIDTHLLVRANAGQIARSVSACFLYCIQVQHSLLNQSPSYEFPRTRGITSALRSRRGGGGSAYCAPYPPLLPVRVVHKGSLGLSSGLSPTFRFLALGLVRARVP
jgi:hypothetical protein